MFSSSLISFDFFISYLFITYYKNSLFFEESFSDRQRLSHLPSKSFIRYKQKAKRSTKRSANPNFRRHYGRNLQILLSPRKPSRLCELVHKRPENGREAPFHLAQAPAQQTVQRGHYAPRRDCDRVENPQDRDLRRFFGLSLGHR